MSKNMISCPSCHHEFEANEAMLLNLKKEMNDEILEIKRKLIQENDEHTKTLKENLTKQFDLQLEEVKKTTEEYSKKSISLKYENEIKLLKEEAERSLLKEKELLEREAKIKEKEKETEDLLKREKMNMALELSNIKKESDQKLFEAENALKVLNQENEIRLNQIKIDARREADAILEEEKKRLVVDKEVALKEYSERNDRLQAKLEEMQRQLKSKDNEAIGQAFENYVQSNLEVKFAGDVLVPVSKGVNGVDIAVDIMSGNKKCGTMLVECKYADNWSNSWIEKAGNDKREAGAELVVIISKVLPKGINKFGIVNGVFVVDTVNYLSLLPILRMKVLELGLYKLANTDRKSKVEQLFNYLSSTEFRGVLEHSEAVVGSMQRVLDNDKKMAIKSFKMRQDDINSIKDSLMDISTTIESKLTEFDGIDVDVEIDVLMIEEK
jgi:hypothetical protein